MCNAGLVKQTKDSQMENIVPKQKIISHDPDPLSIEQKLLKDENSQIDKKTGTEKIRLGLLNKRR